MFNNLIAREGSFERTTLPDGRAALAFDTHIAYYRGLGLSMVEAPRVQIDGVAISPEDMIFELNGQSWPVNELKDVTDQRWELRTFARLVVAVPEGFSSGKHTLNIVQVLRVSYLPVLSENPYTTTFEVK